MKNVRVPTFDFLRGLAIIAVIAVHTTGAFPSQIKSIDNFLSNGRYGVQLFYLISALAMCHTWKRREKEKDPIKKFYIRRILRIAPLFWLAIPVYLTINGFGESYSAPEGINFRQILLTATFLHGFWPDSINSVVPGGWSIAVEMTFYILFPLLIKREINKSLYLYLGIFIWIFNIFIFKGFLINLFLTTYETKSLTIVNDYLYLNFINQSTVFLLGIYLYFLIETKPAIMEIIALLSWALFAAALSILYKMDGINFLFIIFTIGIFCYLCIKSKIRLKAIELLGKNSYSIYLVHFLVIFYLKKMIPTGYGLPTLIFSILLVILISYFLSQITYHFIEKRIQKYADEITAAQAAK
jgi:exopolysaccharide production protein ExoZ